MIGYTPKTSSSSFFDFCQLVKATPRELITPYTDLCYTLLLQEWVDSAPEGMQVCYQITANAILDLIVDFPLGRVELQIDCEGFDTLPPLPTQIAMRICLVLNGQPNASFDALLAHLPDTVCSIIFRNNAAITEFSSDVLPTFILELGIENCPNFTHLVGKFAIEKLKLSKFTGKTLFISNDSFPKLWLLGLEDNSNLEMIELGKDFRLGGAQHNSGRVNIYGDHNKLKAIPVFSEKQIHLEFSPTTSLDSISDYSWAGVGDNLNVGEVQFITLAENHLKQGKPAAAFKLIEIWEYFLPKNEYSFQKKYANMCVKALIGESAASSGASELGRVDIYLAVGKSFLERKWVDGNYQKAHQFFQLALDQEVDLEKKEILKQTIKSLLVQHLQRFHEKIQLLSLLEIETVLPKELLQFIYHRVTGEDLTLLQLY